MEYAVAGQVNQDHAAPRNGSITPPGVSQSKQPARSRRKNNEADDDPSKRRCVSTACIACRKRKSKCDGNTPACAACSQVYGTACIYDPNSDHRRKGVYKNDIDNLKTRNTTLQTIIQAILNYEEENAFDLVREIRTCESLDAVAEKIVAKERGVDYDDDEDYDVSPAENSVSPVPTFETQLYGKMGDLRLDGGTVRFIGGTSNLIHIDDDDGDDEIDEYPQHDDPTTSWTKVTNDPELVLHLLHMYFTWHYSFFVTMSKSLFWRDFQLGQPSPGTKRKTHYCTPLLVNAMLAIGCHFTSHRAARENPDDPRTAGDHFFREAKKLIMENDEHERPRLTNVQAFALMSVREAGCAREAKGWVYSGMSFRMACDMGLHLYTGTLTRNKNVNGNEEEEDVRRITFWGCFLFDKCWSNYLGRLPVLNTSMVTAPKPEVFPEEDSANWLPYSDSGYSHAHSQPARTRAVALQISKLGEISDEIMKQFYNPSDMEKIRGKSAELKLLSSIHTRLEAWRRDLPKEMEPREGGLASILLMHMYFQLLFIHLFRPFLKYTQETSPLPQTVSPRKLCSQAAQSISKLARLYKRSYGLRQIPNVAVYIIHAACTIHLLNLPDKNAKRDIVHGCKHLEEISAGWICASRTLGTLSLLAKKWQVELPEEAAAVLARTDRKNGALSRPSDPLLDPQQRNLLNLAAAANTATSQYPNAPPAATNLSPTQQLAQSSGIYVPPPQGGNMFQQQNQATASAPTRTSSTDQNMAYPGYDKELSPSEMFGGVEQLIRDSQDWIYRDSQQVATGFENWDDLSMDPLTWTNGVAPDGTTLGFASQDPPLNPAAQVTQAPATMPMTIGGQGHMYSGGMTGNVAAAAGMGVNGNLNAAVGYPMTQWLSNADDMATYYNEGAFYQ